MMQRFNAALTSCNYQNNPEKLVLDDKGDYVLYSEYEKLLKAVEFAEYMAKAADACMEAINKRDAVQIENDGEGDESDFESELQEAEECLSDHWTGLRSAIHEFRKRAERIEK